MLVFKGRPNAAFCGACPRTDSEDGYTVSYRGIADIDPERLGELAESFEEAISDTRRAVYANLWNALVSENTPLRAVVNGSLMSVPEDFYDFALRANMPDGEFLAARLIGKTLGSIPGANDRWLYLRIREMLRSGELAEVSPAADGHPYSGVVRRNG